MYVLPYDYVHTFFVFVLSNKYDTKFFPQIWVLKHPIQHHQTLIPKGTRSYLGDTGCVIYVVKKHVIL